MTDRSKAAKAELVAAKKAWREAAQAIRPNRELKWDTDLKRCLQDAQRLTAAAEAMVSAEFNLAMALAAESTPVQEGDTDAPNA